MITNRFDVIKDEAYATAVCVDERVPMEAQILLNEMPWPPHVNVRRILAEMTSLAPYPLKVMYDRVHRN